MKLSFIANQKQKVCVRIYSNYLFWAFYLQVRNCMTITIVGSRIISVLAELTFLFYKVMPLLLFELLIQLIMVDFSKSLESTLYASL